MVFGHGFNYIEMYGLCQGQGYVVFQDRWSHSSGLSRQIFYRFHCMKFVMITGSHVTLTRKAQFSEEDPWTEADAEFVDTGGTHQIVDGGGGT